MSDADDPWTFFGQYSQPEIDKAAKLLTENAIVFEIKEDLNWKPIEGGWSGPHCLWVRDENEEKASSLLNRLFKDSN